LIGTRSLSSMAGIGRRNPILAVLFGMTALAMTGVPPFGMFWSEFLIAFSALAVQSPLLSAGVVLMLVNILISIIYYFRVIRIVVFSQPADLVSSQTRAVSWLMIGPAIVLIVLSLITGVVPSFFYEPALKAIQALLGTA